MVDQDFLKQLPRRPGVYLMKDREDKVLYVGKAVNLYNRVRSYFQSSRQLSPRIAHMVEQVDRVEIIATRTDLEALALESNLIKEHRPKYNVKLRDDKQYPWIKITINETYPRVLVVRRVVRDGARYFGPYTDPGAMWETLRVIRRTFPIRKCKRSLEKGQKERPCLNWHIGRCLGPCQGVAPEAYRKVVEDICLFLSGRTKQLLKEIRQQMEQASAALDFERAARLRDQMRDIERVVEKQRVVSATGGDQDVLGYAMGQGMRWSRRSWSGTARSLAGNTFWWTRASRRKPRRFWRVLSPSIMRNGMIFPRRSCCPLPWRKRTPWPSGCRTGPGRVFICACPNGAPNGAWSGWPWKMPRPY